MPNNSSPDNTYPPSGDRLRAVTLLLILLTLLALAVASYLRGDDCRQFIGMAITLLVNPEALFRLFTPRRLP